ncbi:MAG: hypothetical protein AAF203_05580, partial [Pseudomonadota bacterium]
SQRTYHFLLKSHYSETPMSLQLPHLEPNKMMVTSDKYPMYMFDLDPQNPIRYKTFGPWSPLPQLYLKVDSPLKAKTRELTPLCIEIDFKNQKIHLFLDKNYELSHITVRNAFGKISYQAERAAFPSPLDEVI